MLLNSYLIRHALEICNENQFLLRLASDQDIGYYENRTCIVR